MPFKARDTCWFFQDNLKSKNIQSYESENVMLACARMLLCGEDFEVDFGDKSEPGTHLASLLSSPGSWILLTLISDPAGSQGPE